MVVGLVTYECCLHFGGANEPESTERVNFDQFTHAREWMRDQLWAALDDDCVDCQLAGTQALTRLISLSRHGTEDFEAEVDGDTYTIQRTVS